MKISVPSGVFVLLETSQILNYIVHYCFYLVFKSFCALAQSGLQGMLDIWLQGNWSKASIAVTLPPS